MNVAMREIPLAGMVTKGYHKKMANFVAEKPSPRVTELFKKAFEKASEALPEYEQDIFAQWLLDAIESDQRLWDVALESNPAQLKALVDQALADINEGRSEPLDPNKL